MTDEEKKALLEKTKKADGTIDEDKVTAILVKQKKELERVIAESTARKEKIRGNDDALAEKEKEIQAREDKLKAADEAKLKENEKYQELLALKEKEIESMNGIKAENDELKKYRAGVLAGQATLLETKVAGLNEKNRELYDVAAAGMGENAHTQKLAFLEKLTAQAELPPGTPPPTPPSGTRGDTIGKSANEMTDQELMDVKQKNPELFKSLLKEQMTKS